MNTRDIIGEFINSFKLILNRHLPEASRDIIDDMKADIDESLTEILGKYDIGNITEEKIIMRPKSCNYNMVSWGEEKLGNVLKELGIISDMLIKKELNFETYDEKTNYPKVTKENVDRSLGIALYDLLKIYSFLIDEYWIQDMLLRY